MGLEEALAVTQEELIKHLTDFANQKNALIIYHNPSKLDEPDLKFLEQLIGKDNLFVVKGSEGIGKKFALQQALSLNKRYSLPGNEGEIKPGNVIQIHPIKGAGPFGSTKEGLNKVGLSYAFERYIKVDTMFGLYSNGNVMFICTSDDSVLRKRAKEKPEEGDLDIILTSFGATQMLYSESFEVNKGIIHHLEIPTEEGTSIILEGEKITKNASLMAIIFGYSGTSLRADLQRAALEIKKEYENEINHWNGDKEIFQTAEYILSKIIDNYNGSVEIIDPKTVQLQILESAKNTLVSWAENKLGVIVLESNLDSEPPERFKEFDHIDYTLSGVGESEIKKIISHYFPSAGDPIVHEFIENYIAATKSVITEEIDTAVNPSELNFVLEQLKSKYDEFQPNVDELIAKGAISLDSSKEIINRIKKMNPITKNVAYFAAVHGRKFSVDDLETILEIDIDDALEELEDFGLLFCQDEEGDVYNIANHRMRSTILSNIRKRRKKKIHKSWANQFWDSYKDDPVQADASAHHHNAALNLPGIISNDFLERTYKLNLIAGDAARHIFDNRGSEEHYITASDCLRKLGKNNLLLETLLKVQDVQISLGRYKAAINLKDELYDLATKTNNDFAKGLIYVNIGSIMSKWHKPGESVKVGNETFKDSGEAILAGLRLLNDQEDIYQKAKANRLMGQFLYVQYYSAENKENLGNLKDLEKAINYFSNALKLTQNSEELNLLYECAETKNQMGVAYTLKKDYTTAKQWYEQSINLCKKHNLTFVLNNAEANLAWMLKEEGVSKNNLALVSESITYSKRIYDFSLRTNNRQAAAETCLEIKEGYDYLLKNTKNVDDRQLFEAEAEKHARLLLDWSSKLDREDLRKKAQDTIDKLVK